ncbi:EAL domain-containing protein, partial [Burkholderia sp. SRS-W-2-2016]|uniref:EAL domain-containing protein n=1 Tax=Burkholderia sp. SRS-W-2-2016 TaxID=1926878 RepID=UPI0009F8BFD1
MHTLDYAKHVSMARTLTARLTVDALNDATGFDDSPARLSDLEARVLDGLRAGEFHLVFQGAYRAADDALARLDAQLRWTHPEYGLLLPGIFMMPLEHPRVAQEMAAFVVDSVCRELRACADAGLPVCPVCPVAISVPAQIALLDSFAEDLVRVARSYRVSPRLFEIEIADSAEAAKLLSLRTMTEGLREAGVGVALGKWGNGASSLALLGTVDVDTVTVARELVAGVLRDQRAAKVMAAVLDLLCGLGLRVVVNGVDTKEQLQWLGRWAEVLVQGAVCG